MLGGLGGMVGHPAEPGHQLNLNLCKSGVVIDVPQAVDLHAGTNGYELLHRDVTNVCTWFASKGVADACDADRIFGEVLA